MTDDPMLAKAKALEEELLNGQLGVADTRDANLMHRAALLIQQMRVRLEGENSTEAES